MQQTNEIKTGKFGRFRILTIGRANAGKTTILRAICNSTENPGAFDGKGNKIDLTKVEGTRGVSVTRPRHEWRSSLYK